MLPLSALLLAFPAVSPQESVLSDSVAATRTPLRGLLRRLIAVFLGVILLLTLLATSVELVTQLNLPEKGMFGPMARFFLDLFPVPLKGLSADQRAAFSAGGLVPKLFVDSLSLPLSKQLPPTLVQHWPIVILFIYLLDIAILVFVGKVPLRYNIRNVQVRWLVNVMTAGAFTAVIGLLVFMLAFVNGMNNLTEHTGVPGNVFILSEGSTDELFSNLGYGDLDNVERVETTLNVTDQSIAPVRVKRVELERRGKKEKVALASRETYYCINQEIINSNPPRRRFVQLRTLDDSRIAQAVHNIELMPGGKWFSPIGVNNESQIECVLGEGVAATLGPDNGKKQLGPGDTFKLGGMTWAVTGVMKSEGTTFGSEIWAQRFDRIFKAFGKDKYTTLVMRVEDDKAASARNLANHLQKRYTQQKLKALSEPDYYAELTKTNNQFLTLIVIVAGVMAIGGIFGMMTTMFASIAQRIRDIGVLRLLGFKRWQVMVSFMLESLAVGLLGGAVGCVLIYLLVDGRGATSSLSGGGGGGGKNFAVTINVDTQIVCVGMLFTLVMGRLGGLVPALSAMRMKILDSLR